jgi:hypothetical protein
MPVKTPSMEQRIIRLEEHYSALGEKISGLENKMDRVLDALSEHQARELPPIQTILSTIAISVAILTAVIGALYWLIDTRVGYAVAESNKFTHEMTDNGRFYVWKSRVDRDIEDLKKK